MKVWTNYWKNRAADRMRRIRELEDAIKEFRAKLVGSNAFTPSVLKLFEVLDK